MCKLTSGDVTIEVTDDDAGTLTLSMSDQTVGTIRAKLAPEDVQNLLLSILTHAAGAMDVQIIDI